jgi:endonuclease YncB( thermonuclease family)
MVWGSAPNAEAQTEGDLEQYGVVVTVTRVVDGDTIEVSPEVQGTQDVRLIGADTPEVSGEQEPGGQEASTFTTEQLEDEQVALEFDEETVDRYGRALAYVWLPGGELFNETLVRQGYAEVAAFEPNVKYVDRFEEAEEEARAEGLGIWGSGSEETTSVPTPPTSANTAASSITAASASPAFTAAASISATRTGARNAHGSRWLDRWASTEDAGRRMPRGVPGAAWRSLLCGLDES